MAAEKHRENRQPIVDQDAAITAYLDGLLRDPDADVAAEAAAPRNSPGLKVINVAETTVATGAPLEEPVEGTEPPASGGAAPVADSGDSATGISVTEPDFVDEADESVPDADSDDFGAEETGSDDTAVARAVDEEPSVESAPSDGQPVDDEATASADVVTDARWSWLRVGGMTMAIPTDAVASRHQDPPLEAVPGAPAHVAGALVIEERPRLILSLAKLTGLRERDDAEREVLLLGKGGLWGIVGERVERPPELTEEAVEWRNEAQKSARRPWLAGTAPAAGVAVLDEAGLRMALRSSR